MQKKFEKNIEQAFQRFTIQPSAQVWVEVETALHPQKKRRVAGWWWFALATLLIGSAALGLFTLNSKHSKLNIAKANSEIKKEADSINQNQASTTSVNIERPSTVDNKKANKNNQNKAFTRLSKTSSLVNKKENQQLFLATNNLPIVSNVQENNAITIANNNQEIKNTIQPQIINSSIKQSDSIKKEMIVKKTNIDSTQKTEPNILLTTKTISPWKKFFLIELGSFAERAINKSNEELIMADAFSLSIGTGGIANISSKPFYLPNIGFVAKTGLVLAKKINTRLYFQSGISYQYIQTSQKVGNRIDTGSYIYYEKGNANIISNHLHTITVPIGVQYYFSLRKSYRYFIGSSTNIQYLFGKNWLLANEVVKGYSYNQKLPFTLQASININTGIAFKNDAQLSLQLYSPLGLFYKNNSVKRSYWQTGLQLLYPIKNYSLK